MVKEEIIKIKYSNLIEILQMEVMENNAINEFLQYVKAEHMAFNSFSNANKEHLAEFIRGANRFSDEFIFSEANYPIIRKNMNELYDLINS